MELDAYQQGVSGNNITNYIPTFQEIFPKVKQLLVFTTQALEEAIPKAKDFFETHEKDIDRYLFPNLVRYHAKSFLEIAGLSVQMDEENEEEIKYEFERLLNNGLSGVFRGFRFRILKSANGELPLPGVSDAKQKYYNQQPYLPWGLAFEEYTKHVRPNLIILWEVDDKYNFHQLRLACPKSGGKTRESVQAYFNEPVPHAAELLEARPVKPSEEEVPITKKESKTKKEYIK